MKEFIMWLNAHSMFDAFKWVLERIPAWIILVPLAIFGAGLVIGLIEWGRDVSKSHR